MSNRALWIVGSGVALFVVLVGFGLAYGLSDYDIVVSSSAATDTSSTSTSTTTTSTTTASLPPPSVAGQTGVTVGYDCTSPDSAVQSVVNAWQAGDETTARRCGTDAVVNQLFRSSGSGAQWTFQGCGGPDPGVPRCQYSYEGGAATMTMNGTEAAGWKAVDLTFVPD